MYTVMRCLPLIFAIVLLGTADAAPLPANPGLVKYIPTRIEWLALDLSAHVRHDNVSDTDFFLDIAMSGPDTLTIVVTYPDTVNRRAMNLAIANAHQVIDITTRSYGWSDWVKVKEKLTLYRGEDRPLR